MRIAFSHSADRGSSSNESAGWYLDDVTITGVDEPDRLPEADVKINGLDGPVYLTTADLAKVSFALDAGDYTGRPVELWIGATTRAGNYYYDPITANWTQTQTFFSQGPLADMPETILLDQALPLGAYTFFFVMDHVLDGNVDVTLYDSTEIHSL